MKEYFLDHYYVTSLLEDEYREDLETLFFFNGNQWRVRGALREAVERYGSPRIRSDGRHLTLELSALPQVQALYVMQDDPGPSLVGVLVYAREETLLRVIFAGLDPDHAYTTGNQQYVLLELFEILRVIGRRIRGVEALEFNNGGRNLRLRV